MKKILRFASALLCGAMLLCSLSVTAFAENDDEVYDFDPNTDKIYSEAVYMVNTDTGDVVYKKNENKKTTKLPMTGKVKKGFRYYCMAVMAMTFVLGTSVTAFAANDPIQVVNNLSDFIFGLVRAVGMIMLGFGIVQIGLSLKSHDPSQRANGFLTLAGGVVITFAKEILTLITG